jgi:hypothetical protein
MEWGQVSKFGGPNRITWTLFVKNNVIDLTGCINICNYSQRI